MTHRQEDLCERLRRWDRDECTEVRSATMPACMFTDLQEAADAIERRDAEIVLKDREIEHLRNLTRRWQKFYERDKPPAR